MPTAEETIDSSAGEADAEDRFLILVEMTAPDHSDMIVLADHREGRFYVEVESYVAGGHVDVVKAGQGGDRMVVDLYGHSGEHAGTFHAEREWAEAYNNGVITGEGFMIRILKTLPA